MNSSGLKASNTDSYKAEASKKMSEFMRGLSISCLSQY